MAGGGLVVLRRLQPGWPLVSTITAQTWLQRLGGRGQYTARQRRTQLYVWLHGSSCIFPNHTASFVYSRAAIRVISVRNAFKIDNFLTIARAAVCRGHDVYLR